MKLGKKHNFYLVDMTHAKKEQEQFAEYMKAIAFAHLEHGGGCMSTFKATEQLAHAYLPSEYNPPNITLACHLKQTRYLRWYIHNYVIWDHPTWNNDFLKGLTAAGHVCGGTRKTFSSLLWYTNEDLKNVLEDSPWGSHELVYCPQQHRGKWMNVPALELQARTNTVEYIAGVLATGVVRKYRGKLYARYFEKAANELTKLGIPVEQNRTKSQIISCFWPALFTPWMPQPFAAKWLDLKRAYGCDIYPAIMWRLYVYPAKFISNALPYLPSTRNVYYRFKCPEGAMTKLDQIRREKGMLSLKEPLGEATRYWAYMYNQEVEQGIRQLPKGN